MTEAASSLNRQPDLRVPTTTISGVPRSGRRRSFSTVDAGEDRIAPKRIGLFGLFGCGNPGNDGTLEAMLALLRKARPEAELVCICAGPQQVSETLHVAAIGLGIARPSNALVRALLAGPRKLGCFVHALWHVRKLDVLLVTGGGQLEDFKDQPFGSPLTLFMWCLAARLSAVKIAFVSVGAGPIDHPLSRRLLTSTAAMADYRSWRDPTSKAFMERIGFGKARNDPVCPDIAFELSAPVSGRGPSTRDGPITVGVGVMAYHGWLQRNVSAVVYARYLEKLTAFVLWLLERGHAVRILTGDAIDEGAVHDLVTRVAAAKPELPKDRMLAEMPHSPQDLLRQVADTDIVVATRFHNVVYALKLEKPTLSIGYGDKHDALMTEVGLGSFCQPIGGLQLDLLIEQFTRLLSNREHYEQSLRDANLAFQERLERQDLFLTTRLL